MADSGYKLVAIKLSKMTSKRASGRLKRFLMDYGASYVEGVLNELQDVDRKLRGSDDGWWLEMMHESGKEIQVLF